MALDINQIVQDLANVLDGVYSVEKQMYELYLDDNPKVVPVTYTKADGTQTTVNVDNIKKVYNDMYNLFQQNVKQGCFVNLLKNYAFTTGDLSNWNIVAVNGVTYTYSIQDLTDTDKASITNLIGVDLTTAEPPGVLYKKAAFNITTTGLREDLRLGQLDSTMNLHIYHPDALQILGIINVNGGGWTTDLTNYIPTTKSANTPYELMFGDALTFELFYPVLYPTYNNGIIPYFDLGV